MIIGIDANEANLTSQRVGVNQYAFGLLHALYRQKTDHRFIIYLKTPVLGDLPAAKTGWEYRVIPFPKLWTQTRLPMDLYTHLPRPDVFFSMAHYAPRFSPIPTVVAIMDLGFLEFPDQFTPKDYNQLKNWTAYSVKRAACVIAISENTKKDIISAYGIDPAKITVTYPGYDQKLFKPTKNPRILKKYGISRNYLFFLGSLRPSKNIEGLIKAFAQLLHTRFKSPLRAGGGIGGLPEKLSLVISGKKGWLYDRIFQTVADLGLDKQVIFTGFVEEEEVPALMSHATAFVMPSFYEGFGIPVVNAMACGTPVVVSRVASLPEVVGNAGIFVDPADPASISSGIIEAIGSMRNRYVKAGLKRVKLFDWDRTAQKTMQVIETAVKNI